MFCYCTLYHHSNITDTNPNFTPLQTFLHDATHKGNQFIWVFLFISLGKTKKNPVDLIFYRNNFKMGALNFKVKGRWPNFADLECATFSIKCHRRTGVTFEQALIGGAGLCDRVGENARQRLQHHTFPYICIKLKISLDKAKAHNYHVLLHANL